MLDPQVDALSEVIYRSPRPYAEPTFIAGTAPATYGVPRSIQNIPYRTTALVTYQAPAYTFKSNQLYPIKRAAAPNTGTSQGAAPASGVYTGVPSSGCTGGNPYS